MLLSSTWEPLSCNAAPRTFSSGSSRPLNHGVRACGHFELGSPAGRRGLIKRLRRDVFGRFEAIESFQISSAQNTRDKHLARRFVLPINFHDMWLRKVTVQNENRNFSVPGIDGAGYIQVRNLTHFRNFVGG